MIESGHKRDTLLCEHTLEFYDRKCCYGHPCILSVFSISQDVAVTVTILNESVDTDAALFVLDGKQRKLSFCCPDYRLVSEVSGLCSICDV